MAGSSEGQCNSNGNNGKMNHLWKATEPQTMYVESIYIYFHLFTHSNRRQGPKKNSVAGPCLLFKRPPQPFQTLVRLTTGILGGRTRAQIVIGAWWNRVVKHLGGKTLPTEVPPVSPSYSSARDNRHAFKFSKTPRSVEGKVGYRRMAVV